jgi:hypothetical protein
MPSRDASARTVPSDFAKAKRLRLEQASATREAFAYAVEFCCSNGWGLRELARHMDCDVRTLSDMRDGRRPVYEWAPGALPPEGREAFRGAFGARRHMAAV